MKNIKLFVLIFAIMAMLLTACGQASTVAEPETTEPAAAEETMTGEQISADIPAESILCFNNDGNSSKLMQFFEDGNVPAEACFMYDQMGSNPEITLTDPEQILELYRLLSEVTVVEETNESITDCYHYVRFKLSDDCSVGYSFEGSEIWCFGGANYRIANSRGLFAFMSRLTEEYLENEG